MKRCRQIHAAGCRRIFGSAALSVFCLTSFLHAAEITWTGGGGSSAWSDAGNWEGGTPPGEGDTAVIPGGLTAGLSTSDIAYITERKLALISLPAADSVLFVTNDAQVSMPIPLSGIGRLDISNNCNRLDIEANNSAFTGPFTLYNSTIRNDWAHKYCFGIDNVITNNVGEGLANQTLRYPGDYGNTWHVIGGKAKEATATRSLFTYSDIGISGPFRVENNYTVSPQQSTRLTFTGGLHHSGSNSLYVSGKIRVTGDTPCEFLTTAENNTGIYLMDSAEFELDSPLTPSTPRIGGPGLLRFCRANLLPPTTGLQEGRSGEKGLRVDLNGFDQRCGSIYKMTNEGSTEDVTYITSPTPATLTVHGQSEWLGTIPHDDASRFIALSVRGAASLELYATNNLGRYAGVDIWPKMEIRNCPSKSDTTGGLRVRRGTLTLAETTAWPNLGRLEAHGEGLLVMNTDAVNPGGFEFVVSNVADAAVTIAAGKCLHAKTAYVDRWLEPGEYGGVDAGLDAAHTLSQLGGGGRLVVDELGGPKGVKIVIR